MLEEENKRAEARGAVSQSFPSQDRDQADQKICHVARLKRDRQAVELEVDEVAVGVAGGAAGGDVAAAGLLDGDGD